MNVSFSSAFKIANDLSVAAGTGAMLLLLLLFGFSRIMSRAYAKPVHPHAPPFTKWAIPFFGPYGYFYRPWDFARSQRKLVTNQPGNPFQAYSFNVRGNHVVAINGVESRKWFLNHSKLDLGLGYKELFNGGADIPIEEADLNPDGMPMDGFIQRLKVLMSSQWMNQSLMYLIQDSIDAIDQLGSSGMTDPFISIYELVFQLTVRTVGCVEIAENADLLGQTLKYYEGVEAGLQPIANILPKWFPNPAAKRKQESSAALYYLMKGIIKSREEEGRREEDALQILIDRGENVTSMIQFLLNALLAGQLNSGINAAWMLCYLAAKPEWMAKARDEVGAIIKKHGGQEGSLSQRLKRIPLEVWEEGSPILELTLKESIRLNLRGNMARFNLAADQVIGNYVVPKHSFVVFSFNDSHFDPDIYTEPTIFDPERFEPGREEDKNQPFGWMGFGGGRHPCAGMRFAKLEMNIICFIFIARFEWDVVPASNPKQSKGLGVYDLPKPELNQPTAHKPSTKLLLRYRRREDSF